MLITIKFHAGIRLFFLILVIAAGFSMLLPHSADTAENHKSEKILLKAIEYREKENRFIITIKTSRAVSVYKSLTLENPARIVFDLPNIQSPYRKTQNISVGTEWVHRIRHYGDAKNLRVVIDTEKAYLSDYKIEQFDNRLVIALGPEPATPSPPEKKTTPIINPEPKKTLKPAPVAAKPTEAALTKRKNVVMTEMPDPMIIIGNRLNSPDAEMPAEKFNLQKTILAAISANIELKISREDTEAAGALKKRQRTFFYPTIGAQYRYTRNDDKPNIGGFIIGSQNEYEFSTTFTQPLFTGFGLINQYKIAALGLDIAKFNEKLVRQDIILDAKASYFNLLKGQKLVEVANKTVEQIAAQMEVAKNFYQVGMTPLNSFLQSQVELANAQQDLIIARNNLETAISDFNTLLRRPINAPVDLEDITTYTPFGRPLQYCQEAAEKHRLELYISNLDIEKAEKELGLVKKDFFPSLDLQGRYFKTGDEWNVDGGAAVFDPEGWSVSAMASWDFWQWGRTGYDVMERKSRLKQARHAKDQLLDLIRQQVKRAYLKNIESEISIVTIKTAIDQAEENLRINQERFKEQVSTSTDVLVAQTLLTQTMTNFYNALYDFKISKAALYRAMGQETIP
jgi:outer membrane protein